MDKSAKQASTTPQEKTTVNMGPLTLALLIVLLSSSIPEGLQAAKLVKVSVLDKDYLVAHVYDGEVIHHEGDTGEEVIHYSPELDVTSATDVGSWRISSVSDSNYNATGVAPDACYRKKKLNGHARLAWAGSDFEYDHTYEQWIYLQLPSSLEQGNSYTLTIDSATNIDTGSVSFTFDVYNSVSEALHVNLIGYNGDASHKAADLYSWLGDGGARDYSTFEGNDVSVYNVHTGATTTIGEVTFWKTAASEVGGYNLTGSDVWSVDLSELTTPGTYRLVVEGVGCSQDFVIAGDVYSEAYKNSVRGYFYMRIGEKNPNGITPPPRTPLYIPGIDSVVHLTTMHPYHDDWNSFSSGDYWDKPSDWTPYIKSGSPTNPDAWGGHSDAADWDRFLNHVSNIYDLLLPFLLSEGSLRDDDAGITESGNSIPDILDEARNEVDFWLRLRDGDGYSHGLTNPMSGTDDNGDPIYILYQAGATPMAAWANAANAAMLADAFQVAGLTSLMQHYRDEAISAFNYADNLPDPMLDTGLGQDEGRLRGRDLRMMAAAFLYNVTGNTVWEDIIHDESVCAGGPSTILDSSLNQLYATAAYLMSKRTVHYSAMRDNMLSQITSEAMSAEAGRMESRPSRRATDQRPSYWRTAHFMGRTLVAHAAGSSSDREYFQKAMNSEAGWGLGRNPLNMIEMTTATTVLAEMRSVPEAYTSGRNDGVSGVHPGHTPYMNLNDWAPGSETGTPSALYEESYPTDVPSTWPIGETYFPSRWVWPHNEFTPRQTMRGKMALYGYLHSLSTGTAPATPTLSVTVTSVAGGMGSITSLPTGINCSGDCSEEYSRGTSVTLTATPDSGSVFTGWSGACYGEGTCELQVMDNLVATATFQPVGTIHEIQVSKSGSGDGTVTSSPGTIDCGTSCHDYFLEGSSTTLRATPDIRSSFTGWSGDCSGTGECQLTLDGDHLVTATFMDNYPTEEIIYDDTLGSGWQHWSWGYTIDLSGTSQVKVGSYSADVTLSGWGAFSPAYGSGVINTHGYRGIGFWVHGGTGSDKQITLFLHDGDGNESERTTITAAAGNWTEIFVPFSSFGSPASFQRLNFFNNSSATMGTFTLDQIHIIANEAAAGDVDLSGAVALRDALLALQVQAGSLPPASVLGDSNGDGRIGVEDAVSILKALAQ